MGSTWQSSQLSCEEMGDGARGHCRHPWGSYPSHGAADNLLQTEQKTRNNTGQCPLTTSVWPGQCASIFTLKNMCEHTA